MDIKKIVLMMALVCPVLTFAQSFNEEQVALANYVKRMYEVLPFEGVKIIEDYNNAYLISVVTVEKNKYPNESLMFRVASAKSMSQTNDYLNGSQVSSTDIIRTNTRSDGSKDSSIISEIRINGLGYVKSMELLSNFPKQDNPGTIVCVYCRKLCVPDTSQRVKVKKKNRRG